MIDLNHTHCPECERCAPDSDLEGVAISLGNVSIAAGVIVTDLDDVIGKMEKYPGLENGWPLAKLTPERVRSVREAADTLHATFREFAEAFPKSGSDMHSHALCESGECFDLRDPRIP